MGKKYLKVSHMKRLVSPEADAVVPRRVLFALPVRHHDGQVCDVDDDDANHDKDDDDDNNNNNKMMMRC